MQQAAFYTADLRKRGDDEIGDKMGASPVGGEGDELLCPGR